MGHTERQVLDQEITSAATQLSERAEIIRMALIDYSISTIGREKSLAEELAIVAPQSFDAEHELIERFEAAKAVGIQQEQRIMDLEATQQVLLSTLQWMVQRADEGGYPDGRCLIEARAAIAKASEHTQ
jgi:hypothetical protein